MSYDQRGSEIISEDECRRLLKVAGASGRVGRLAINPEGSPYVIPVNFSVSDQMILIRLGSGFAAHHLDGQIAAFEIDHAEPYSKRGWSRAYAEDDAAVKRENDTQETVVAKSKDLRPCGSRRGHITMNS
jgi:hypothetical protein